MKKFKNIIKTKINKLEIAALTMALLIIQVTPAFAAIDGNTIQRNLVSNVLLPAFTVLFLWMLLKDFSKRNTASTVLICVIGGIIGIFMYKPEAIKTVIDFISSLIGL